MSCGTVIGVLPAAGVGSRLAPSRYAKELLPVVYEWADDGRCAVTPRAVVEVSLAALRRAGVSRCLTIVAPWKLDVVRYLGSGHDLGIEIGYLYQEAAQGLAHAVDLAHGWTAAADTLLLLPDTVLSPPTFARASLDCFRDTGADLTLAVFPTDEPERLGPVEAVDGVVTAVHDKPALAPVANTWGAAVWGPRFADLLHAAIDGHHPAGELPLGSVFQEAVRQGLHVTAVEFPTGSFLDVGTPQGLGACIGRPLVNGGRS